MGTRGTRYVIHRQPSQVHRLHHLSVGIHEPFFLLLQELLDLLHIRPPVRAMCFLELPYHDAKSALQDLQPVRGPLEVQL